MPKKHDPKKKGHMKVPVLKFSLWSAHDLDQASMKDISLGSQSLKKVNATTRHICVKICIMKIIIWLW